MATTVSLTFLAFSVLGVVVYLTVALSSIILSAEAYSKRQSRLMVWRELLIAVMSIFQMIGLISIANGTNDFSLWTINRFVWMGIGITSLVLAGRAMRAWAKREVTISFLFTKGNRQ